MKQKKIDKLKLRRRNKRKVLHPLYVCFSVSQFVCRSVCLSHFLYLSLPLSIFSFFSLFLNMICFCLSLSHSLSVCLSVPSFYFFYFAELDTRCVVLLCSLRNMCCLQHTHTHSLSPFIFLLANLSHCLSLSFSLSSFLFLLAHLSFSVPSFFFFILLN
jgi:hypothetical protein